MSKKSGTTRRELLAGAAAAGLAGTALARTTKALMPKPDTYIDLIRHPDLSRAFGPDDQKVEVDLSFIPIDKGLTVRIHAPERKIERIQLRWKGDLSGVQRYFGDHWERSYGDLEWRGEVPNRTMPWYMLTFDGHDTHGYGVVTQPNAFCFWNADSAGISLWIDVRNGGSAVELGDRLLELCTVVARRGHGDSPFSAAQTLCKLMCPSPNLPNKPVYGTNDWYYSYGDSSADLILKTGALVSELSPNQDNRPYSVIDGGWSPGGSSHGPWDRGTEKFGDMAALAAKLVAEGLQPGIWIRPLAHGDTPENCRLPRQPRILDPSVPEALALVKEDISRLRQWGYRLIKHDFSSWDLMGRWGFSMGSTLTDSGWHFTDRTRTSAEVILDFYRAIREAAGNAVLIGCNTFSHLSAGIFELNRIGDDTSGRAWDRTRRMGVNALAFRAAQHGTFYAVDADIAPVTSYLPWDLSRQWLDLLAASGAPLFVSPEIAAVKADQRKALQEAFKLGSETRAVGEPLDWLDTVCPARWKLRGKERKFSWMADEGSWPFSD